MGSCAALATLGASLRGRAEAAPAAVDPQPQTMPVSLEINRSSGLPSRASGPAAGGGQSGMDRNLTGERDRAQVGWKYAIIGNHALNGVNPPLHAWS
jgi:hypothetical protein